ncbi:MAG: PQQ-binding-like beta-propeller repeat protein [Bryobacteraceae bacterium]|nr:PQQ-binding-like beta-propeller repeat protein [Bryobacteraceae bacterium]
MTRRALFALLTTAAALYGDWLTFGGDPQRSGFQRRENYITQSNVSTLRLEWKMKLDNQPKELTSLTVPVIAATMTLPGGFKDYVVVAGSSDALFAIDPDTQKLYWSRKFEAEGAAKGRPDWLCPAGLNATPVIDKRNRTVYVITSDGKLRGVNLLNGEDRFPPTPFVPPFSKNWSLNLVDDVIYTTVSQGCNGAKSAVYAMDVKDPKRPVTSFLSTTTGGAGIWGRAGAAIGFNGRVYAETGDGPYDPPNGKYADTFLGLNARDLKLVDYYTPANRAWITRKDLDMGCISPVVFQFKGKEIVAGGGKEGVLYLLDGSALGGEDKRTPLYRSNLITNEQVDFAGRGFWGVMSTYEDSEGTRWLFAPAWGPPASSAPKFPITYGETPNGSIMAFKIEEVNGKIQPVAAWNSVNMSVPEPVIISNGMVFALSNGENISQVDNEGRLLTTKFRADNPAGNAVLYALDAKTGKVLYSSGKAIPGWTHFSGLAMANGRIYVVTHDSTIYAFSVPD